MRTLFFGNSLTGHLLPLLPLARAFRERGDRVAFCTAAPVSSLFDSEDVEFLSAGPMPDVIVAEVLRTTGHDLGQGATVETEAEYFAGARIDLTVDEALAMARDWRPDLIVSEQADFVGPLVGAILDVPVASLAYGPAWQSESVEPLVTRLRSRYEARGLAYGPPRWYLDTCPPALQHPDWEVPEGRIGLRPEAHRNPGQEPAAKPGRDAARPCVLVSFGMFVNMPEIVGPMLAELGQLDVDVRVTRHRFSPDEFGVDADAAGRVEFVEFTPLAELLQGVDAVLTHGGAGTVLGALSRGIPMVVVPHGAGQPALGERVAAAGAGISFPLREAPAKAVAESVARILADAAYRERAQEIAAQIAGLSSPADVAEHLASALAR
ncbi:glycosyltransferase [Streptomyces cadmiisoli]|uniref:glycosyltransferase n=1 Tax=Streptomyces cadmiisoli TaxID=2184053 RepID=UPI003647A8B3